MSGVLGWVVGVPIAIVFMVVCNRYLFLSGTKVRRYKIVSGRRVRDYAAESALTAATTPPRRRRRKPPRPPAPETLALWDQRVREAARQREIDALFPPKFTANMRNAADAARACADTETRQDQT